MEELLLGREFLAQVIEEGEVVLYLLGKTIVYLD